MRADGLMTADPAACEPENDLGSAIRSMHERRCGALPVVDAEHRVVGILTDRDIVLALGAADARPSDVSVDAVMTRTPRTCRADETVHRALDRMRANRIRRLPVIDDEERLVGLVSIDDIVLAAQNVRAGVGRVSFEQAMEALEAICARSAHGRSPAGVASREEGRRP